MHEVHQGQQDHPRRLARTRARSHPLDHSPSHPEGRNPAGSSVSRLQSAVAGAKVRAERARTRWPWFDVALSTARRYSNDDAGSYAASLTYYLFFSLFPLIILAVSIIGLLTFLNPDLREDLLEAGLRSNPLVQSVLSFETLRSIEERAGSLALAAIALALYTGTGTVVALTHALNKINRVPVERTFLGKRWNALKWLAMLAMITLLSLVPSVLAQFAAGQSGLASVLLGLAARVVAAAVNALVFLTAFKVLPNATIRWSEALPGAIVAGAAFELLKVFGAMYLQQGAQVRNQAFGVFAAGAGLLVIPFLAAQMTLLAAELNAVLADRRTARRRLGGLSKGAAHERPS